jgi:hypothetical protein
MRTPIFIDNCAWDYFFEADINLSIELPSAEYQIFVTPGNSYEIDQIPDIGKDGQSKEELKLYIQKSLQENRIQVAGFFGFAEIGPDGKPLAYQSVLGFDQGTFAGPEDAEELQWLDAAEVKHFVGKLKATGVRKNASDAALAAKSFKCLVLTNESIDKSGPLRLAASQGGAVIFLADQVGRSGLSLGEYLRHREPGVLHHQL